MSTFPLNSISITADRDFDSEHPAGSLLNDLFVFEYSSAYDVIKSGYDYNLDMSNYFYWNSAADAYKQMPLLEFESKNLLNRLSLFYFTKLPETLGEYTFTIAYKFGTDPVTGKEPKEVVSRVITVEFTEKDYVSIPMRGRPESEEEANSYLQQHSIRDWFASAKLNDTQY